MAGIIAGKDAGVDTKESGSCAGFAGMAPDARIISVKAADAHGATDVSQILAGIDWVVQHAHDPGMNIRVLNLSFGTDLSQSRPVGVKLTQDRYTLEGILRDPVPFLESAELKLSQLSNTSGEYLGSSKANAYDFETFQAELLLAHQPVGPLSGLFGASHRDRNIRGSGSQRYLPDVDTEGLAAFIKETLDFDWASFDAGFRHERIEHTIQQSAFTTSRNSPNAPLEDRAFTLNSYNAGGYVQFGRLFGAKARYSSSARAPDVNELYASNRHYSVMTQEEGDQDLKPERARNAEFTLLFNNGGFDITATAYRMKIENFLYQGYSGLQTANRLPLKYWKQTDTTVKGFEVDVSQSLDLGSYGKLALSAFSDLVKNKADNPDSLRAHNDGEYLPNMPTNRFGANVAWERGGWKARVSSTYYDKQKYLGKNVSQEIPLDAFNLLDAQVSYAFAMRNAVVQGVEVFLNGSNLLDEDARPHNSPLKYIAPLPGRGFQVGVTVKL